MNATYDGSILTLSSEQRSSEVQFHSEQIPVGGGEEGMAVIYAGYRRCSDFDLGNHAGQDYISLRADERTVVGVVADGVGQSFYGDLAGRRVAKYLLEFLWTHRATPPSDQELTHALLTEAKAFESEVNEFAIPSHLTPLLREALAITRAKGSQAVFAAFIFDLSHPLVHVYQVGDVDVYIFYEDQATERIQAAKRGRWSSGAHTELLLRSRQFGGRVSGILAQSDGSTDAWASTLRFQADVKQQFDEMARIRASVDDVSFLSVSKVAGKPRRRSGPVRPAIEADRVPASPSPTVTTAPIAPPEKTSFVRLSAPWVLAIFAAGVLSSLLMAILVTFLVRRVHPSASPSKSSTGQRAAMNPAPPPVAKKALYRLDVTTSKYAELKQKIKASAIPIRDTAVGEISVWAIVPPQLPAATLRLATSLQTSAVSQIASDDARRFFCIIFAHIPQNRKLSAVAELLDAKGMVLARGEITLAARDLQSTTRGYYVVEPVPAK